MSVPSVCPPVYETVNCTQYSPILTVPSNQAVDISTSADTSGTSLLSWTPMVHPLHPIAASLPLHHAASHETQHIPEQNNTDTDISNPHIELDHLRQDWLLNVLEWTLKYKQVICLTHFFHKHLPEIKTSGFISHIQSTRCHTDVKRLRKDLGKPFLLPPWLAGFWHANIRVFSCCTMNVMPNSGTYT